MLQQCNCFTTNVHVLHAHFVTRDFGIRDCCYCYCFVIVIVIVIVFVNVIVVIIVIIVTGIIIIITSRAARGGGGSFKNSKRIGEIGCCESRMTKRKH